LFGEIVRCAVMESVMIFVRCGALRVYLKITLRFLKIRNMIRLVLICRKFGHCPKIVFDLS